MSIAVGDKIPAGILKIAAPDGAKDVSTDELFGGKKVVLFAVPGAFTPLCSAQHLPGYVGKAAEIKAKGKCCHPCRSPSTRFVAPARRAGSAEPRTAARRVTGARTAIQIGPGIVPNSTPTRLNRRRVNMNPSGVPTTRAIMAMSPAFVATLAAI